MSSDRCRARGRGQLITDTRENPHQLLSSEGQNQIALESCLEFECLNELSAQLL